MSGTVAEWLEAEWGYQMTKFTLDEIDATTRAGEDDWSWRLNQYLHRAQLLGLENSMGRQALAKYVATAVGMLDSVQRVHGPLPAPGVPSGEISEWTP